MSIRVDLRTHRVTLNIGSQKFISHAVSLTFVTASTVAGVK